MAGVPMIYREVLTLRFEDEMKIEEIAQVTAVPVSTVKSRLGVRWNNYVTRLRRANEEWYGNGNKKDEHDKIRELLALAAAGALAARKKNRLRSMCGLASPARTNWRLGGRLRANSADCRRRSLLRGWCRRRWRVRRRSSRNRPSTIGTAAWSDSTETGDRFHPKSAVDRVASVKRRARGRAETPRRQANSSWGLQRGRALLGCHLQRSTSSAAEDPYSPALEPAQPSGRYVTGRGPRLHSASPPGPSG